MMLVGFFGCFGAVRESQCLLGSVGKNYATVNEQNTVPASPSTAYMHTECCDCFKTTTFVISSRIKLTLSSSSF